MKGSSEALAFNQEPSAYSEVQRRNMKEVRLNATARHLHRFIQSYPHRPPRISFSPQTKKCIEGLLRELQAASAAWKDVDCHEERGHAEMFSAIPAEIRYIISTWDPTARTCQFRIDDRTFRITMSSPDPDTFTSVFFANSVKLMYMWLRIATQHAPAACSRRMNIDIYLTRETKQMSGDPGEPLGALHANTAFTTTCLPETNVVIFRQEEWFKVFVHETFHSLGLDFSDMKFDGIKQDMSERFCLRSQFELFETYNETWAELINLMFVGFLSTSSISRAIPRIETMLQDEICFSLFQSVKILQRHGRTLSGLCTTSPPIEYREDANVFCYYVLKSMTLFGINDVVEWCVRENGAHWLNFRKDAANMKSFYRLVCRLHEDPAYVTEVHRMEAWISKDMGPIEQNTMRMTIYG